MRPVFAATVLAGALVLLQPAAVMAEDEKETSPEELTAEAMDRLLKALELFLGSLPQYEAPYVNENGDIIIKRKHPQDGEDLPTPEEKPAPPETDSTTT